MIFGSILSTELKVILPRPLTRDYCPISCFTSISVLTSIYTLYFHEEAQIVICRPRRRLKAWSAFESSFQENCYSSLWGWESGFFLGWPEFHAFVHDPEDDLGFLHSCYAQVASDLSIMKIYPILASRKTPQSSLCGLWIPCFSLPYLGFQLYLSGLLSAQNPSI